MRNLKFHGCKDNFSDPWCDFDQTFTSVLEATSFVTPLLEEFFIETISACIGKNSRPVLARRCQEFIRDEAVHLRAHKRFNVSLIAYLEQAPPGVTIVRRLLEQAKRRMALVDRLLIVAVLEHFTAVFSKWYLRESPNWQIRSEFASQLFTLHAREELGHKSVVYDLWLEKGHPGISKRRIVFTLTLLACSLYALLAARWISRRKTREANPNHGKNIADAQHNSSVWKQGHLLAKDLLLFIKRDFHPDQLSLT